MEGLSLLPTLLLAGDVEGLYPSQDLCHTLEGLQSSSTLSLKLLTCRRGIIIVLTIEDISG